MEGLGNTEESRTGQINIKKVSVVLNHSSHAVVLGILFFCMLLFAAQWLSWTIRPALCAWLVWRGVLPALLYGV